MPVFRKFTNPRRVPKWFDDDISAHHLVCERCDTPGQAIVPVCTTCNTSVFLHLKRKVAITEYNGPATHETLFLQMREAQAQLIRVEQLLDSLQETRRALKEFITIRRVKVTPPIMTLPREILVTIFDILGTTNNNIAAFESIPAVVLSQVCRDFRAIAFGTPRLWSSIKIQVAGAVWYEQQIRPTIQSMTKGLQICAERSGSMPIDLLVLTWVDHYRVLRKDFQDVTMPFFKCLAALIPRLRLISETDCRFMAAWIFDQPTLSQVSFPHLQVFNMVHYSQEVDLNLSFLRGSPCLEQLHVNRLPNDLHLASVVRSRQMKSLSGRMSISALTNFPLANLESLQLTDTWSFNATSIPQLLFPSLRSFRITGQYWSSWDAPISPIPIEWFSRLCCPQLENLSLRYAYFDTSHTYAFQGLLGMLDAPVKNRTFHQLSLSFCSFADAQLHSLLTSVPSITSFRCCKSDGTGNYLPTILQNTDEEFLPHLQTLIYECPPSDSIESLDDNMVLFFRFLEGRLHGSLHEVKLRTEDSMFRSKHDPSIDNLKAVGQKVVDSGLQVDWQHWCGVHPDTQNWSTFF